MPRTLTFPSPSTDVCPVCDDRLTALPCPSCGADLERPESAELLQIDHELHRLSVLRGVLVQRLLEPTPAPVAHLVVPPPPPPPTASSAAGGGRVAASWSVAEILVGLGGLSLVAAVVVFAAVAWSDLAAWAQGGLLVGATGAMVGAAIASRRRDLTATAESLGMVSMALAVADVEVARTVLDGAFVDRTIWGFGLAAVAAAALVVGRRFGLRGMAAAGAAVAFVPLPLLAAGFDVESGAWWALAIQALVAVSLFRRVSDATLDRPVLAIGATVSWVLAALFGIGTAVDVLATDVDQVPVATVGLLASLAVSSVVVGFTRRVRNVLCAGLGLVFVPAVLIAAGAGSTSAVAATLVAECALAVVAVTLLRGRAALDDEVEVARSVLDVGAAVSAAGAVTVATVIGVADLWLDPASVSQVSVATFLALAAVAVGGSLLAGWKRATTSVVLVAGVMSVFAAAGFSGVTEDGAASIMVLALTGAVLTMLTAVLVRLDADRPWTAPMGAAALGVAALAVVPLAAAVAIVGALAEVSFPPVEAAAASSIVDHLATAPSLIEADLPTGATVGQLAAIAAVGLAGAMLGRRWGSWVLTVAGLLSMVTLPVVIGLSIVATAAVYALAILGFTWRLVVRPDEPATVASGALAIPLLAGVALASAPLTIVATTLVTGALAMLAYRSLDGRRTTASLWVSAALVSGLGGLTIDALRFGSVRSGPALLVAGAAALASATGPAIERWRRQDDSGAAVCADIVVGAVLVLAVLATRSLDAASGALALTGLVAGVHALRPSRRPLVGVAIAATVVLTWMRLAAADVTLLEAYTLPLAGALLLAGALVRPARHSSWVRSGAGLFAALGPTALLAVSETDVTRTLAVVLGGAAAAVWGAVEREQAPLAIGGAALTAVALRHLGPVANELPRYVVFAVAGVSLLAAGATFEQRRRDLRRVREVFGQLG